MAQPMRPARHEQARDSEPLAVIKIKAEFPNAYRPGDRFTLRCHLNRAIDAYEERLLQEREISKFDYESAWGSRYIHVERTTVEEFSLPDLQTALEELSSQALDEKRAADREMEDVRRNIRSLSAEL